LAAQDELQFGLKLIFQSAGQKAKVKQRALAFTLLPFAFVVT
jgi:hypothetical protein